jgi:hypothetical protein
MTDDDPTFYIELESRAGMRRPMSYSDSFVANMEPSDVVFLRSVSSSTLQVVAPTPTLSVKENYYLDFLLRLLFHVSLISIFETIFFFVYVSTLEDNGILSIVNGYIEDVTDTCSNLNTQQKIFIQDLLIIVNATTIIQNGNISEEMRNVYNKKLFNQAWYYMAGIVSLFACLSIGLFYKKYKINYKIVVLENLTMILLLGIYEFMFFQTIIFPYQAIGASEIDRNFIQQIKWKCS